MGNNTENPESTQKTGADEDPKHSRLVLVVDDEPGLVMLVSSILTAEGYPVLTANSTAEALEIIKEKKPDIVVSDIRMPGEDGFVLLQKSLVIAPSLCVILMTGHGDKEVAIKAVRENAFDYISKPFKQDELLIAVDRAHQQITLQKKIETDRINFQFALVQAAKLSSLGTMAAGLAHELNNPLAGIYAYLWQLIESPDTTDENRETLQKTYKLAERMAKVISHVLTFARESQENRITQVNFLEVISEAFAIFEQKIKKHKINITFDIAPNIPLINGDKSQLISVVHNLISNSCDAFLSLPAGTKPRLLTVAVSNRNDTIELKFVDNAGGIAEAVIGRIFDPFFTTKPIGKGTGLGLSVSHKIVEGHHGKISCQSKLGEGTTFLLSLPGVHGTVSPEIPSEISAQSETEAKAETAASPNVPKILIIDNEDLVCEIFELMGKGKFKVTSANDTRTGFNLIEREDFDLIVTDVNMTHIDGVQILEKVKKEHHKSQVVIMSGRVKPDYKTDSLLASGAAKFITKPNLNKEEILKLLQETLEHKQKQKK